MNKQKCKHQINNGWCKARGGTCIWSEYNSESCLKEKKFDPKTLQSFDKVLVRDSLNDTWRCSLFSHIIKNDNFPYKCVGNAFVYCIPYNDDTKHLVGTTDEAPEYYRYWED